MADVEVLDKVEAMHSSVRFYPDIDQGSEAWLELRRGVITASEMHLLLTTTLKVANNEKTRAHLFELAAQRISGYVEPTYIGDDMLRGMEDEIAAIEVYEQHYGKGRSVGFVTNDQWGFTIGYSPDRLIGEDGLLEIKSRRQKFQVQTILNFAIGEDVPDDYVLQCQAGLLVTKRKWLDFISYSGGLPMMTVRTYPDPVIQDAIVQAAGAAELRIAEMIGEYEAILKSPAARLIPTERRIEQEMYA